MVSEIISPILALESHRKLNNYQKRLTKSSIQLVISTNRCYGNSLPFHVNERWAGCTQWHAKAWGVAPASSGITEVLCRL